MSLAAALRELNGLAPKQVTVRRVPLPAAAPQTKPVVRLPIVKGEAPLISVKSMLDMYLHEHARDEHKIVVEWNKPRRRGVFHPSSLCKDQVCERALAYELYAAPQQKVEPQIGVARLQRIFDNGTFVHARLEHHIAKAVQKYGGTFYPEVGFKPDESLVAGTTDGGILLNGWPYLLEIKSMNKKNFMELGQEPWDEHADQLTIYMRRLGVTSGVVFVECKDNQDTREYFIRFDVKRWARMEAIVNRVLGHFHAGELPPKITKENGCKGEECEYHHICKGAAQKSWTPPSQP